MQAGGIVAFQQGGNVDAKKIQQFVNMGLTDDQIKAEVEKLGLLPQAADRIIQQVRLQQKQDMSLQPPQPKTQSIDLTSDDPVLATQGTQPKTPPPTQVQTPPQTTQTQTQTTPPPQQQGIATAAKGFPDIIGEDGKRKSATQLVTEMRPLEAPQIDTSKANEAGLAVLKDFNLGPDTLKDPEQYRKDVRGDEADFFRREEKMQNYQDLIDRQEALNAEQSDPKTLAREQLQAGLIGMAGRGSTAGAGFGAGAMAMGRSQKRDAQTRLKGVADMVDNMEKQDLEVAKKASDVGREALTQAAQDRRSALQAMYTMRGQEIQTVIDQAKLDYNANKDNVKSLLDASVADATNELRLAVQEGNDAQRAGAILADLAIQKQRALTELEKNFKSQDAYRKATLDSNSPDADTATKGLDKLAELDAKFAMIAQEMFRQSGADQLEADIRKRLGFSAPQVRFNTAVPTGGSGITAGTSSGTPPNLTGMTRQQQVKALTNFYKPTSP